MIQSVLRYSFLILIMLNATTLISQEALLKRGNDQYEKYEYINAQKTYRKALRKGYQSAELYKNLGNSYYFNSQFKEASKWYIELIMSYPNEVASEYYARYAQSLKSTGRYEESDLYMKKFSELAPNDERAQLFINNQDYLTKIQTQSGRYEIQNLDMNSAFTDFGTSFYGRYIVFSSSNAKGAKTKNIHQWNKESYLDFYIASYDTDTGALSGVQKWNDTFNSEFHESTPIFTNDKQTVYFTRNDEDGGDFEKIDTHSIRTDKLKIYRSYLDIQGNWSSPEELPFNNSEYSVAHPALSKDGTKLYFSSDMPGGKGESDLYEVAIHSNGSFGVPKNLGDKINTEGKETFPFVSTSNDLYFSSDGHPGLGGLDIFVIRLDAEPTSDNLIYNVGKPVNSPADDFAFIIDEKTKRGYFSSNRTEGKGKDDIYSFIQLNPLKIGDDLAKILALNPIYFDLDKSFIRPDAAVELDKVVKIMKEFPNMEIDVRSHTDSRASFNYNIKLSERRAKSTVQYLVDNGILRSRMTSKGYGETVLLNKCKDDVYCSEAAHQLNRRSEFIITK